MLSNYGGYAEFTAVLGTTGPGRIIRRRLDSEVFGVFAPIVGVAVGPFKGLKASFYWRGEMITSFSQPIDVELGTFGKLNVMVSGVTQYTPHTLGLGVGYTFLEGRGTVGLDVGYERWSATPPLVPQIHITLPQTLEDLGFHEEVVTRDLTMDFSDTFVPRLGLEYRPLPQLSMRAGYILRPSPVPDQRGRSNFLDSMASIMSLGVGWAFKDPLEMGKTIHVDLAGQLTALNNRYVEKQGANLQPNYRFGGTNMLVNLAVKYQF
jgi:long-subunit fatty acid transport protein